MHPHLKDWPVVFENRFWKIAEGAGWTAVYPTGSGVPGACLVTDVTGNVVLVSIHRPPSGQPRWEIPRGRSEDGETYQASSVREAREETGLDFAGARVVDLGLVELDGGILGFHVGLTWVCLPTAFPAVIPVDASEVLDVQVLPWQAFQAQLRVGTLVDALTTIAGLRAAARIQAGDVPGFG